MHLARNAELRLKVDVQEIGESNGFNLPSSHFQTEVRVSAPKGRRGYTDNQRLGQMGEL